MKLRLPFVFTFCVGVTMTSYCQNWIPVNSTIKTPYGNVSQTSYMQTGSYVAINAKVSKKYKFDIVLKNDSMFSTKVEIGLAYRRDHYIIVNNKGTDQVFFPSDTKSISRVTSSGKRITGIPVDSCWLFKTYIGEKINGYSFLSEPGSFHIIAIQEGENGPILPLTRESLLLITRTNDKRICKMIENGKLIEAIEAYNFSF
jgi:hypothetical protein